MGFKYWENQPHGKNLSSAEYLAVNVHRDVIAQYYSTLSKLEVDQELNNAKRLTRFFYNLKNYPKQKANIAERHGAQYVLSMQLFVKMAEKLLKEIPGRENVNRFLFGGTKEVIDKKAAFFQNEINIILQTIQAFSEGSVKISQKTGNPILNTKDKITLKGNFDTGTGNMIWEGDIKNIENFIEFSAIQEMYRTTASLTKIYDKDTNTSHYSNPVFNMLGRQIKADIVNTKGWDFQVLANYGFTDDFLKDLSLLQYCSFSLKNYEKISTVSLGESNIVRLLLLILPTFNSIAILNPQQYVSFLMALFTRYYIGPKNGAVFFRNPCSYADNINLIGLHFFHIQMIYELSGVGQQAKKTEETTDKRLFQLNNLLSKGVQYLIVNDNTSEDIRVLSVKKILYDTFQYYFQNNNILYGRIRIPDYRRGTQSIVERKFNFSKNIIT